MHRSPALSPGIGVIGAGFISRYHLEGLRSAGADVRSVCSRKLANARARSDEYDIADATDDLDRLLSRDDINAVVIATPDATHEELTIRAAAAGKSILLQKPMGLDVGQCRRMIEAAENHGVGLYVSFMHRYFEEVQALRSLLRRGELGRILSVRQRNATPGADWAAWFYSRDNVGGGVMMQLGVHGIDLLRYLFGEIDEVAAAIAITTPQRTLASGEIVEPDTEDLVLATYRFASGLMASHEVSYNEVAGTDRFRLEVYGEEGTAWLRSERGRFAVYTTEDGRWTTPVKAIDDDPGPAQHRHFLAMLTGEAPDDGSARDGLFATAIADAVYRSAADRPWTGIDT